MATSLIRATFGRISNESISRITIGHISINGEVVDTIDRRGSRSGGKAGKHRIKDPKLGVRFIPFKDKHREQALKEDMELIELTLALIEGNLI